MKRFIADTYACIDNRGTHKAIKKLQKYMRKTKRKQDNYYILKCDIKNFFYTINKDILFNIVNENIKDKKLLYLTKLLIYDNNDLKGIPIGNYTSQYFANIYLNELDKYIKEILKIKYYVRYMDDFVLLINNREESKINLNKIKIFLKKNLDLDLNIKTNYYPSFKGIDFCGYRIFFTHKLVRNRSKKRC